MIATTSPPESIFTVRAPIPRDLHFPALKYNRNQFLSDGLQTGHAVWPCSRLLCDYLVDHPDVVRGKNVLELGCGLGVCGSVAAILEAETVTLSDGDDAVLEKARSAAESNGLFKTSRMDFRVLRWGPDCPGSLPSSTSERYDVILGSDLMYGPPRIPLKEQPNDTRIWDLLNIVNCYLSETPTAVFLLAFERRNVSFDDILRAASEHKLNCSVPEGEYYEDIFSNRTEEMTDFWRACLFQFHRTA